MPRYFKFLIKFYLFLAFTLTFFRAVSFALLTNNFKEVVLFDIAQAFLIGWRFDNVIICAILVLPFLLYTLNQFFIRSSNLHKKIHLTLIPFLTIIFILQVIDLFYFNHFFVRVSSVLLNWISDIGFAIQMALSDPNWFSSFIFIPALIFGAYKITNSLSKGVIYLPVSGRWKLATPLLSVGLLFLLFLGIRGRIAIKSPIREGTAYFSGNPTLNQLGLNPSYTFFSSLIRSKKYLSTPISFMKRDEAIKVFNQSVNDSQISTFIQRKQTHGNDKGYNIILVIMEGMSDDFTNHKKNPSWTPNLDRLKIQGIEFKNSFSAGIHTYNGIWSTLFSYPAPYSKHPLKRDIIPELNSFAKQLADSGRETFFFTTHDDQFDNMAGFVRQNGFSHIIHQANYPQERVFSILGVPDHDMFNFSLPILKKLKSNQPFFASFLTGSAHKPYVIPPELKDQFTSPDEKENIVRYADWAIGDFVKKLSDANLTDNTLVAFIADHGQSVGSSVEDQSLSYHHVPFIIWSPKLIKAEVISSPLMQIDVMPTLLNLLGGTWVNNTLGRDVLKNPRQWIYFGNDTEVCLLESKNLECESQSGQRRSLNFKTQLWDNSSKLESSSVWNLIHAELQISDIVLKEHKLFN